MDKATFAGIPIHDAVDGVVAEMANNGAADLAAQIPTRDEAGAQERKQAVREVAGEAEALMIADAGLF